MSSQLFSQAIHHSRARSTVKSTLLLIKQPVDNIVQLIRKIRHKSPDFHGFRRMIKVVSNFD